MARTGSSAAEAPSSVTQTAHLTHNGDPKASRPRPSDRDHGRRLRRRIATGFERPIRASGKMVLRRWTSGRRPSSARPARLERHPTRGNTDPESAMEDASEQIIAVYELPIGLI